MNTTVLTKEYISVVQALVGLIADYLESRYDRCPNLSALRSVEQTTASRNVWLDVIFRVLLMDYDIRAMVVLLRKLDENSATSTERIWFDQILKGLPRDYCTAFRTYKASLAMGEAFLLCTERC